MKELSVLDCCPVAEWIAQLQRLAGWKQAHEEFRLLGIYMVGYDILKNHIHRTVKQLREYRLLSRDFRCY